MAEVIPSAADEMFLVLLNRARANPRDYGASIGLNLSSVVPSPPLSFDLRLVAAAQHHSWDMAARRYFGHWTPDGLSPADQIEHAGYPWRSYGQAIAAGSIYRDPAAALKALIIDAGVGGAPHRRHLLAMNTDSRSHTAVGVGTHYGSGPYTNYYTINTGLSRDPRPVDGPVSAKVKSWYSHYLRRATGPGEETGLAILLLSGMSDVDGLCVILGSAEYYARAQASRLVSTPELRFLDHLYLDLLDRLCDPSGLAHWGPQVWRGLREPVIRAVLESEEYRSRPV